MKKTYTKPAVRVDELGFQPISTGCADAADWWDPIYVDDTTTLFVPGDMAACTISENDYANSQPGNDGSCYYATTSDGVVHSS